MVCVCSFQEDNCDKFLQGNRRNILSYYSECLCHKKKKKIDPMAIAKTSCEDFREMKSESRNDQPELIFKMVGLQ